MLVHIMADTKEGKAWTYSSTAGGFVENLRLTGYRVPDAKDYHVLIEVLNVSLNPGDYKLPDVPLIGRFIKRPASPCFDFCGRIRALSRNLARDAGNLHVGQVVFGIHRDLRSFGTLKTIMWVHRDSLYPLPNGISIEHGSALGVAALTAWGAIAPYAKPNGKILILGGTGGVGTFCIQIAKALQMHVIATCSTAGAQLCKDLGADEIIEYTSSTFQNDLCKTQVDLVVDNIGHDPGLHRRSEMFLHPDGQFVLVAVMDNDWTGIRSMLISCLCPTLFGGPQRKWKLIFTSNDVDTKRSVAELVEIGKLRVVVDSIFAFQDVPEAFRRLKTGRAKGKIIVDVHVR